jgi:hypothetical protein
MRSRTSHAAKSGVGEHKARESESAQHCADGKECVASTHPQIWPRNRKVPRPYCFWGSRTAAVPKNNRGVAPSGAKTGPAVLLALRPRPAHVGALFPDKAP